jgi:hypothetical protein
MIIKGQDFILTGKLGHIAEGRIKIPTPGKHEFYCPSDQISGTIHILKRNKV